MTKKLQQDSVWAKYDIDNDGTVSDEELEQHGISKDLIRLAVGVEDSPIANRGWD